MINDDDDKIIIVSKVVLFTLSCRWFLLYILTECTRGCETCFPTGEDPFAGSLLP